jgi:hypothetical protein
MPIDPSRREEIAAAVATWNQDHSEAPLPSNTVRLLAAMFPSGEVCQRSLVDIAAEGFSRKNLPETLRRLVEAGILTRRQGVARIANAYHLAVGPKP